MDQTEYRGHWVVDDPVETPEAKHLRDLAWEHLLDHHQVDPELHDEVPEVGPAGTPLAYLPDFLLERYHVLLHTNQGGRFKGGVPNDHKMLEKGWPFGPYR